MHEPINQNPENIPDACIDAVRRLAHACIAAINEHLAPDAYYSDSTIDEFTMTHDLLNIALTAFNSDDREHACCALTLAIQTNDATELDYPGNPFLNHPFNDAYELADALSTIPAI